LTADNVDDIVDIAAMTTFTGYSQWLWSPLAMHAG